jgi:RNA polymerase sigma-70 factor, ECF subfamily
MTSLDSSAQSVGVGALRQRLDGFLRTSERRALIHAELALRSRDDALDVVQEAMAGFVKSYSLKPEAEWGKLFYAVLSSKILDFQRRQSVRRRFRQFFSHTETEASEDMLANVADVHEITLEQQIYANQAGHAIDGALKVLPGRQRQAFLLRMWEGMDVAQTAAVMRCSEGSVKTHLSRALSRLRELLGDLP